VEGGLGLPLEYKKCYKKVMIKASKNYMGLNAETETIETVGLVGKKRNQCKLVKAAFEKQREYWKDDVSNEVVQDHIKDIIWRLDSKAVPLVQLQEKNTIQADPWTGYSPKALHHPVCVLGRKDNKHEGESTPPYYLSRKEITGDYAFTEDPNLIDYSKYKERLRTALTGMLEVRNYSKADINQMLELVEPKKQKREKK
jgi:DNA polymerase elongation subunit (family B)